MNRIEITGRLTTDPELRALPDGTPACRVRLAVKEMGRGRDVGYVDVTEFGAAGEAAARELSKGWLVAASGRLKYREWDVKGDYNRHDYEVIGHIEFLAAPNQREKESQAFDQGLTAAG
ncbi:MAG TPA: single-stranded DNA-binding protein [Solirubrobacteraceae bacterium]|jgi:single-strand DNA-binding protein|nr:single-stranded DNA-binding protein [Solirubrobacteraceae bacterium]